MVKNLGLLLPSVRLAGTVSAKLFAEDPVGFTAKVAEKFRMSTNPVLHRGARLLSGGLKRISGSPLDAYCDAGEFTAGIQWAERQRRVSRREAALVRVHREKLERLRHDFPARIPMRPAHTVVHYLTNSLPYTNSGYTLRSQKVLQAQNAAGIHATAMTRLGYPLVIGQFSRSQSDVVGGVTYHRMLPKDFPTSLTRRDARATQELVDFCREQGAEALQTTTDYTNAIVVAEAAAVLGIPWVYEVRGELESTWASRRPPEAVDSEFYALAHAAETRAMLAASHVVTLSEVSKRDVMARGVPEERITVVPNAVDDAQLEWVPDPARIAELRSSLGIAEDQIVVGAITSVVEYEGLDTLIRAAELLPDKYVFVIVGDGTDRTRLEAMCSAKNVHFVGKKPQSEVLDWYALVDVFVIPRKDLAVTRKVTPIKGLQAQALGTPVVASDLPALREVTGGVETYVIPESPEDLARGIADVAGTRNARGVEWARQRSWSANSRRYQSIFLG
ncbi:group 1 glycosyl transferase [Corynebacterium renale]|uniref:glycosyltransferase family 4 protein n=1 Tax=Corynebacterium renale TaxID=1724 RepID=UPI000DA2DCBB|nr:glycosyltransferase family 4 protein [Corynebacterium renale]SQG63811.1 group 1 glycosyl transferase [Corynebacterium renale]STD02279.1 group 1 glycosyl transferase [Corynebacterium renale]